MSHVHQALLEVRVVELGRHEFDQATELIGEGASVATRPITLVKGVLLHTHHEVDQENANVLKDYQRALYLSLVVLLGGCCRLSRLEGHLELLQ